jgi:hypothetical protein
MKRLAWFAAILLLAGAGVCAKQLYVLYHPEALQLRVAVPVCRAARDIYPFSIIPGGVINSQELAASMNHDPVAREHYEGIEPERLWPTEVQQPMMAYVSYRKGDKVFWTDHKVQIAAGEKVLTDGVNLVRGRCGNRIAFKRPTPLPATVSPPEGPPPDIVFEAPLPGLMPPSITEPMLPAATVAQNQVQPKNWEPPIWCCSAKSTPNPVPEPGTLALVGSGIFAAAAGFRRKRR